MWKRFTDGQAPSLHLIVAKEELVTASQGSGNLPVGTQLHVPAWLAPGPGKLDGGPCRQCQDSALLCSGEKAIERLE